jgi:NodT family efflux transporter outer membrane factor (OMF) lipoprotein
MHRFPNLRRALAAAFCAAFVAGCAVGPDFVRPRDVSPRGYLPEAVPEQIAGAPIPGGGPQRLVEGAEPPARWWTLFGSAQLDNLVDRALRDSPAIKSAQAASLVAQETALSQRGILFPSVQGNLSSSRQKVPVPLASPLSSNVSLFTLHTAQLAISYVFDVFGGNRRQVESLEAQAEAQRFQLDAAVLTLASNVVVGAVQEASLRAQVDASREIIRIETEQRDLMRRQLDLGAIPRINVVAQEAALAQAAALVPPLERQLAQQRNALAALEGRFPGDGFDVDFELSSLELPPAIPLSLPSRLVENRPDVRAAEAQLHAAAAQVGVATANMLPQITLSAGVGYEATGLRDLVSPGNVLWNATAGLAQPIFQGGALLHRKRAAQAAYEQALAQYRAVVITAFQNVADALRAIALDSEALRAAASAQAATLESLQMTRKQVELGDIGYLGLLAAQQAYQQAVINRVQAQAARLSDTAALFQALGGGWELTNRQR